jgi:anti-anti-sigma factor
VVNPGSVWYSVGMALNDWSDRIVIAELADEPALSEDLDALSDRIERTPDERMPDIIVNMRGVAHLNSSNIAQLLRLRKQVAHAGRRMRVCSVGDQVWSVIMTSNLDGLFSFNDDVAMALASLQIEDYATG